MVRPRLLSVLLVTRKCMEQPGLSKSVDRASLGRHHVLDELQSGNILRNPVSRLKTSGSYFARQSCNSLTIRESDCLFEMIDSHNETNTHHTSWRKQVSDL